MGTKVNLTLKNRIPGCFLRDPDRKDVVDTFYAHKGIQVLFGRSDKSLQIRDWALLRLEAQQQVSTQAAEAFKQQV